MTPGFQVRRHLGLQGGEQHTARPFADDLVEQRAPGVLVVYRRMPDNRLAPFSAS
jgi:hypothetical protein